MANLTQYGQDTLRNIASRYGVSEDAVQTLLIAVNNGGGTQAQFSHQELGGMGQWSMGGMTMVGDMFNNNLKALVDNLCTELSNALANGQVFQPVKHPAASFGSQTQSQGSGASFMVMGGQMGSGWPEELGQPSSSGAQNNLRYAFFPSTRRLAIDVNGQMTIYYTGDHQISGVSQQQSGDQSLTFTSQFGMVRGSDLKTVTLEPEIVTEPEAAEMEAPQVEVTPEPVMEVDAPTPEPTPTPQPTVTQVDTGEIFALIEQLASLHEKGILTDDEFTSKKTELLSRL